METASTRITIREISDKKTLDQQISRIRFAGLSMGNSAVRKVVEFIAGIYASFNQGDVKLFKVSASSGGYAEIMAIDTETKASLKLSVYMLRKQIFHVDFRFPHAMDFGPDVKY